MKKNIPIRSMLRASPDKVLLEFDFSQAESWIVAHLANSQAMKDALNRAGTKFDIHYTTARGIYNFPDTYNPTDDERYMGKKFNHGTPYGISPQMIAHMINAEAIYPPYMSITIASSKTLHQRWLFTYPEIPRWWLDVERQLGTSMSLKTPYGRERRFYQRWGPELFKEAYAYIPQSTIGDHCLGAVQPELGIKGGLREIYHQLVEPNQRDISILNTAHDSCILECPTSVGNSVASEVYNYLHRPLVVNGEQFTIPVDCKIGERWGELEKLKIN